MIRHFPFKLLQKLLGYSSTVRADVVTIEDNSRSQNGSSQLSLGMTRNSCIDHLPQNNFCLYKANNITQLALGGSINSSANSSAQTGQLAFEEVGVMVRDMHSRSQCITTSYLLV
ncbi:hypothetical protein AVEN_227898-1 [Araneus ventricosus]|uniref:Uncharacterized protein n=1 Tax=Araneus ventricosus TaxID=182803 RepID=A0A4Y2GDC1_ARAVE|nr:hypothetical protein AVEN_227898-1 [Araneus ventricosus]